MEYVVVVILSYLLGTVNPAVILGKKLRKIDIREHNSKNAGTSNVAMTLGLKYGILVGVIDILKGVIPVVILRYFYPDNDVIWFVGGISAILGHVYPFYLGFRGGKGTATLGGVVLGIAPIPSLVLGLLFFIVLFISDYIAVATLMVIVVIPIAMYFMNFSGFSIFIVTMYSLLSFYKHYPNFVRILRKQEVGLKAAFKRS